jgi:hypothetical protein
MQLKTGMLALALASIAVGAMPQRGRADGCLMPTDRAWRERRERALINEPDQKAMIYYHNGVEQLVISPGFDGAVGDFAWVVPVPARPQVEVLKGAPFHELARLVEPAPRRAMAMAKRAAEDMAAVASVQVLERKTVGDYDVSVLASTDANALLTWLRANRYHLPEKAVAPMQSYIREGWTFVACRIKSAGAAEAMHSGTLTPLRLIFPAANPIYPMRLSSANPQPFTVLTYLVLPQNIGNGHNRPFLVPAAAPGGWAMRRLYRAAMLPSAQRYVFPTLAGLSRSNLDIYCLRARFTPNECSTDFIWNLPKGMAMR